MGSNSNRKYGSSGRSGSRKRVVIGADETVRVRYRSDKPHVESERRPTSRQQSRSGGKAPAERSRASYQGKRIAAAKREEREKRQRAIRLRRILALTIGAALVVGAVWGVVALYRAPIFEIKKIQTVGARQLDYDEIVRLARIPAGETLVRLDSSDVVRRLEASPWVADASVDRDFPSTLRLIVRERQPAAIVDTGGTNLWVISKDGYWLGKRSASDTEVVVVRDVEGVTPVAGRRATSKEVLNAVKVAAGLSSELIGMTRAISAPTVEKTALITNNDVEVFIGPATQLAEKDRIVRGILKEKKGEVIYINVRVVESPIWRGLEE